MAAVRQHPMAMLGLAAVVGAHLVMVAVMSMTPVHLQALDHAGGHQHSQTDTFAIIGFTISLHMAGMYALSPLMGWLTDRLGRTRTIIVGQLMLLAAAALAGVGQQDTWLVGAGLTLLGLGWSASVIAGSTLLAESVPEAGRVPAQGLSDTLMGAAGAMGAALSGPVLAALGFAGLNAAAAVVAVVLLGAAATARRRDVPRGSCRLVPDHAEQPGEDGFAVVGNAVMMELVGFPDLEPVDLAGRLQRQSALHVDIVAVHGGRHRDRVPGQTAAVVEGGPVGLGGQQVGDLAERDQCRILLEVPGVDHLAGQQRLRGLRGELREVLQDAPRRPAGGFALRRRSTHASAHTAGWLPG